MELIAEQGQDGGRELDTGMLYYAISANTAVDSVSYVREVFPPAEITVDRSVMPKVWRKRWLYK